jgi:choline dehydrogenase
VAANLARAGHKVLVMEAGDDSGGPTYSVPAFSALASEDPRLRWDYFVQHYSDPALRRRDSKYVPGRDGVLYPRAGTLGGCTAHNAMITIYPHASDWDGIAAATGDASWAAPAMRAYFERLERCRYRIRPPIPALNLSRHGFDGWLTTNEADPLLLAGDEQLQRVVLAAAEEVGLQGVFEPFFAGQLDPNDWRLDRNGFTGLSNVPLATRDGQRTGTRELLLDTARALPDKLVIKTNVLVTRILFDGRRAIGVEYLEQPSVYRADPRAPATGPEPVARQRVLATREVVLCAGAFNSPQLLKLSGVGPRDELARHGIPLVADLPGVGENLQDRYEIGVVTRMRQPFALLRDCSFAPPAPGQAADPCYAQWLQQRGVYTTNGSILGIARRSAPERPDPDLFIFGLPGFFRGYYPGYSAALETRKDHFTWAILKAHTNNTAGRVTLRSADPRDPPLIEFHYFNEGNDVTGEDLASVVDGVAFVRRMNRRLGGPDGIAAAEIVPGAGIADAASVGAFVADEAWGHHASCSNRIGPAGDRMAVVDSAFRVHGLSGLRVVDASVFPRIPGFFIVTAVYMVSEKASDAILSDARASTSNA